MDVASAPGSDAGRGGSAPAAAAKVAGPPVFDGRLSVVVPVRNEADNVEPLVREIARALAALRAFEIVYVDDGSDDRTHAELGRMRALIPQLRCVRHARSCGQSTAILTGVRSARHPWIATLDGDGQNDPADIALLWQRWQTERAAGHTAPLLLAGWRVQRRDTALRRLSSRVANGVRARLLGDATPDTGCGLKLFARDTFLALPYFDHMHRFLPALVQRSGGRVESVVVAHRPRTRGRSKYGVHNRLWVGIVDLFGVAWLMRRARRPEVIDEAIAGTNGDRGANEEVARG
jgi:dolichol-phosphate mannosyltransferase